MPYKSEIKPRSLGFAKREIHDQGIECIGKAFGLITSGRVDNRRNERKGGETSHGRPAQGGGDETTAQQRPSKHRRHAQEDPGHKGGQGPTPSRSLAGEKGRKKERGKGETTGGGPAGGGGESAQNDYERPRTLVCARTAWLPSNMVWHLILPSRLSQEVCNGYCYYVED